MGRTAVIVGAGPAGLTCALELLRRTDVVPIVFEASDGVGGIARTFNYKGNRIDLGGHRFFSKSDRVMNWWREILPLQGPQRAGARQKITYQKSSRWLELPADGPDPDRVDAVMLLRPRTSRILYRGALLDYPVSMSLDTLRKLGVVASLRIVASYLRAAAFPLREERTLEQFFINRFGRELYETFFREYTEKVWGVPCTEIAAEWGSQRIKGLSLMRAVAHAVRGIFDQVARRGIAQKQIETSLIEQFLYPKFGPGQMWETAQRLVEQKGGTVRLQHRVTGVNTANGRIAGVRVVDRDGVETEHACDFLFSTMAVRDLLRAMPSPLPADVRAVGEGLVYRDFITVGLLLDRLRLGGDCDGRELFARMPDNWIYVQEPGVKVGRLQFFNNWSPYMVADPDKIWIGLEYFCNEGDELWSMGDAVLARFAIGEVARIGVIRETAVLDSTVIRARKTYPAYFGSYDRFDVVRRYLDEIPNLHLLGRNGMHRYNNQDHSMLTAMVAVDGILAGRQDKADIWAVNTESDYGEER